jgi:hypothetical protein
LGKENSTLEEIFKPIEDESTKLVLNPLNLGRSVKI